jgi:hypothetical protein
MTAAVTMTSCNNDEAVVNNTDRNAVQFASTGTEALQTRVNGENWDGDETIGIYMVENGTTNVAESAENIPYSTSSTGATATFSPSTDAPTIYYPVSTPAKVDFIAYYPYKQTLTTYWTYPVNVANQTSQSDIDLLWKKENNADNGYDKTQATVNLAFTHQLTKLNLTVQPGAGVTDLTNLAVRIKGMNTTAGFDIKGTAGFTNESNAEDITPYSAGSYNYEAILLPVETLGAGHSITFTIGNDVYTWKLSGVGGITGGKLESGKKYAYTVTLSKHAISVTGTIVDWGTGEAGGTGTAD